MFDEEESKKLRIFQREKRLELQLIIQRCSEIKFEYVCLPSVRSDNDLCFGSKNPRKIHLFADDKTVNSYIRKCFKEHFPEPDTLSVTKKTDEETKDEEKEIELKPTYPFASKVPRFLDITIDSSGVYLRKKTFKETPFVIRKSFSAFGTCKKRKLLVTRNFNTTETPGVGTYNLLHYKTNYFQHSFGGDISIKPAFDIVCTATNLDIKCDLCESELKNIYWKSKKTHNLLCRACYDKKIIKIRKATRGVIDQFRIIKAFKEDYEKKRYCDFFHKHSNSKAAIRLMTDKQLKNRISMENFLNTRIEY
ncbi:CLUMA_CG012765, isoform A [Clunio marinus]|uniref:CLUMA_CG012765, isoform A n=1 Tax=Clunio marinus TaxID=568069 RepID=A0A1J1IGT2_9DIPT|nr:CLUMA_CG012765, isoform A [Clunio marinus]